MHPRVPTWTHMHTRGQHVDPHPIRVEPYARTWTHPARRGTSPPPWTHAERFVDPRVAMMPAQIVDPAWSLMGPTCHFGSMKSAKLSQRGGPPRPRLEPRPETRTQRPHNREPWFHDRDPWPHNRPTRFRDPSHNGPTRFRSPLPRGSTLAQWLAVSLTHVAPILRPR